MVATRSILEELSGLEGGAMATAPAPIKAADILHRVFGFPAFRGVQGHHGQTVPTGQHP